MYERRQRLARSYALGAPLLLALIGVGIAFFVWMGIRALGNKDPEIPETDAPVRTTAAVDSTADSVPVIATTAEPVVTTTEEITTAPPTTEPLPTEPPQVMTTVDDSYFSDALFIGDSRTDGLRMFSPPGDARFYCGTSMNIYKIMDSDFECWGFTGLRNLLKGRQFGKIYIMFGINEAGYSTSSFADKYREVLEEIRADQPEALIYVQSICYVTQNHENKYPVFATSNLKEKNAKLMALADEMENVFYLEINDCLNDGTDHLPSDYTGDGVHLKANCYRYWHDYLLEHAIVDAAHPWTAGGSTEGAEIEHP